MIKFRSRPDPLGRVTVGLGLSAENIRRLQQGDPILFPADELGFAGADVLIFVGDTEQSMTRALRASTDRSTRWNIDPKLGDIDEGHQP